MNIEKVAKALTIFTFVTLCWVAHRALQVRTDCVSSSYLSLVLVDSQKIFNCAFESRLDLKSAYSPLQFATLSKVRVLESLESLNGFIKTQGPKLAVEIVQDSDGRFFEMGKGYVRLGREWLEQPHELRRSLIMGLLNSELPQAFSGSFELGVMTDFLTLTLFSSDAWTHAPVKDLKFSTTKVSEGFGPVLALGLAKVYASVPLTQKVAAMQKLRNLDTLPLVFEPLDTKGASLALWFEKSLRELAGALGIHDELAIKQTLKQLEVEAPTHWELTVDVTKTPAWKEILEQLKKRSEYRPKERILVFTPEGTVALPSGLPVEWEASDVSSQKHVMIACTWPAADQALHIQARHIFAEQSCDKLSKAFWD